jgi:hypothetical protein
MSAKQTYLEYPRNWVCRVEGRPLRRSMRRGGPAKRQSPLLLVRRSPFTVHPFPRRARWGEAATKSLRPASNNQQGVDLSRDFNVVELRFV